MAGQHGVLVMGAVPHSEGAQKIRGTSRVGRTRGIASLPSHLAATAFQCVLQNGQCVPVCACSSLCASSAVSCRTDTGEWSWETLWWGWMDKQFRLHCHYSGIS